MTQFQCGHIERLVGLKVTGIVVPAANDEFAGSLEGLKFENGTVAWIMQDPEGNGPGFLDVNVPHMRKER